MHRTPDGETGPGRQIRNARPARRPDHRCDIPVRARIVWDDDGAEQWIDTTAAGWSGPDVYVDATQLRRDGYRINYVWLDAADVQRRPSDAGESASGRAS